MLKLDVSRISLLPTILIFIWALSAVTVIASDATALQTLLAYFARTQVRNSCTEVSAWMHVLTVLHSMRTIRSSTTTLGSQLEGAWRNALRLHSLFIK